jgi:hypothetical protein
VECRAITEDSHSQEIVLYLRIVGTLATAETARSIGAAAGDVRFQALTIDGSTTSKLSV